MNSFQSLFTLTCIFSLSAGCFHPGLNPVSPGMLLQTFSDISKTIGVFPDARTEDSKLLIVNEAFDQCMGLRETPDSGHLTDVGNVLVRRFCDSASGFRLGHAGGGFVKLGEYQNFNFSCIGAGIFPGSLVYSGDWCESASHQFATMLQGDAVKFVNRETSLCLSSSADDALIVDNCKEDDFYQKWRLCKTNDDKCWPSNRPVNIKTASMEENKLR